MLLKNLHKHSYPLFLFKFQKIIITIGIVYTFLFSSTGSLTGVVIDADTQQPLVGANIILNNTSLGIASDLDGQFKINEIIPGSYSISASMIGYSSLTKINVNIFSQRHTPIKFELNQSILEGEKVIVKSTYFEKAKDGIVSTQTIDREEIRSDPVGAYDIQMMVHSLPSVVTNTDQNNEIIVRGGGPGENLFLIDNLEIPNPNHFGEVGTGGGPVNIINTEFVERIDFYAGGFPAKYGDKQSSVMNIHLRDGNSSNFDIDAEMSMAGIGLLIEGPIINKNGSYISSYRKSFVKNLIKSAGLTSVPEYSNTQHRLTYNINPKNKIIFNLIGAIDAIDIVDENRPDLRGAENVSYSGYQYTYGLTYKSLFSKKGYTLLSIGKTLSSWNAGVYKNNESIIDTFFTRDNIESDLFYKFDIIYKINSKLQISSGFNFKLGKYEIEEKLDADTLFQYIYEHPELNEYEPYNFSSYYELISNNPNLEDIFNEEYCTKTNNYTSISKEFENNNSGSLWKNSIYLQFKYNISKFIINTGFRYDNVKFNNTSVLSPRLSFSFLISPISKVNFAIGKFYQTPNYWMLLNPNNTFKIKNSYTDQVVVGLEYLFADDIKLTVEAYHKNYFNRPIKVSDITDDTLDNQLGFVDIGKGYATGLEIFLQKKFSLRWYGTMSYSHSKSEALDYRENKKGYYPWDYDPQNAFTLVGGYKIKFSEKKWYKDLKKVKIFPILSLIPFSPSDQLEISFRYRYSGGLPFTAKKFDFMHRRWYTDNSINLNDEKSLYYSRLDLMILRRFNFEKFNLTTFIDLQNIFNRNNEWERVYIDDGTYEMSYQYKQIPVGGVIIEF